MSSCLIYAVLIFVPWSQNPSPSRGVAGQLQQNHSGSPQQPSATNQRGTEESPLFIKEAPTPKTKEETAQETKDREDKATNDRKLTDFTRDLVIATGILAAIGLLQLGVFGYQAIKLKQTVEVAGKHSRAMEDAVTEANRSASAMEAVATQIEISAKASVESVIALKERTAQQMRAYLCVIVGSGVYQERAKGLKFQATPTVINTGHTPAHKVSVKASAAILSVPLPEHFNFPLPDVAMGSSMIGPQQHFTISPIVEDFVDDREVENIKRGTENALYAWGILTYKDVFGEPQETKFCQIITWLPDNKVWGYYTEQHNDAT